MAAPGLEHIATLEREIRASLEHVWENVRDWEHLPWLHGDSFASVELRESGSWGWRARLCTRSRPDERLAIELLIEPDDLRYVTRTVEGRGCGTEIWTYLEPVGDDVTAIRVEFWLPDVPESERQGIGQSYVDLYQGLWDEDESMMRRRGGRLAVAPLQEASALELGSEREVRARLPLLVEAGGEQWRIVDVNGDLHAHSTRCPHMLGPLGEGDQEGLEQSEVRCPWHGYRFDVRSGQSCDGRSLRLRPAPRVEIQLGGSSVRLLFGIA